MAQHHAHPPAPCLIVIFGASGDLTKRKLLPALFHLAQAKLLPENFAVVGVARRDLTATFAADMRAGILASVGITADDPALAAFMARVSYLPTDFERSDDFAALKAQLATLDQTFGTQGNRLFYLAVAPASVTSIVSHLGIHGMAQPAGSAVRLIIEKPFGTDLTSARQLNAELGAVFAEEQLFRIDHYLGKDAVQNILPFRFNQRIFEAAWHTGEIEKIEITADESLGIGSRGAFYEKTGAVRDILQNHLMEVLALVAMEPPSALAADAIHAQKLAVWQAIAPLNVATAVRGQYGPGHVGGQPVPGYRQEAQVDPASTTETFAAIQLHINTPRWAGVPFYLRAGKRLNHSLTEVKITFKSPPAPFANFAQPAATLTLRLQPDPAITLKCHLKTPGPTNQIAPAALTCNYAATFGTSTANGYERLLLDALRGDATLFAQRAGVEATWALFTPLLAAWAQLPAPDFPNYAAGSSGPTSL